MKPAITGEAPMMAELSKLLLGSDAAAVRATRLIISSRPHRHAARRAQPTLLADAPETARVGRW